jgi:dihydrofolate synthase / folylpolyglutamate synthase
MVKMPHWPIPTGVKPIDLDLTRIKNLLEDLGNPQDKLPPIIHVAGTNGKGSTTAFLKAIFQAAGYKVHVYNSPHLVRFNERIILAGNEIDDNFLYEVIEECRTVSERSDIQPTFFEATTASAFLAFSKVKADVVLLEVGLGGRLDATNVIDNPAMSIITSISLEHVEFLGDDVKKIAYEKAGIIKPNSPCVVSQQYPEVMEMLNSIADQSYSYEHDWIIYPDEEKNLVYEAPDTMLKLPAPNLQGAHQYVNAGNAITAVLNLKEFDIKEKDIAYGISHAVWPARIQCLSEGEIISRLSDDWQVWVDGAHNEASAHVLSIWLEDQEAMPTYMIFGMTRGRDCQKFLQSFLGKVKYLVGVLIEAEPSSYNAEFVKNEADQMGIKASAADSIDEAFDMISKLETGPARIIVCGSLYLAGDVLYQNQKKRT